MAFKENFKLEETYYKNLKTLIVPLNDIRKKTKDRDTKDVLDVVVQCVGAILQILRHLNEEWNVLLSFIQKNADAIKEAVEKIDAYHDELNEKIDEVNNYLLSLIRELEAKVDALEMCTCKTYLLGAGPLEKPIIVDPKSGLQVPVEQIVTEISKHYIIYLYDDVYGMLYSPVRLSGGPLFGSYVWEYIEAPAVSALTGDTGIYFLRLEYDEEHNVLFDCSEFMAIASNT